MDIRILQYFLAVTREQSILGAANALHISQPALSRQLRDLEEELGKTLFLRSNRHITLTEDGMLLRKRAEEIISLMQKTTDELMQSDSYIAGDIHIGSGETDNIRYVLDAAKKVQDKYPQIHFHIVSGDLRTVTEDLDRGLIDFGILFAEADTSKYDYLEVPSTDRFGVLMRKDDPFAKNEIISLSDLKKKPLIISRQLYDSKNLNAILHLNEDELNISGTYNLLYNGSIMVEKGMGYAICYDKIINTSGDSALIFKPLDVAIESTPVIIWKKYQVFSKAAQKFKDELIQTFSL